MQPLDHPSPAEDLFDVTPDGVVLRVHVQPKAGRDVVTGRHGDALKVRVTAPPVDGRANAAVARQLADLLGVAPSAVSLVSGPTSRSKRFLVAGVDPGAVRDRLAAVLDAAPPAGERPRGRGPGNNPGGSPVGR